MREWRWRRDEAAGGGRGGGDPLDVLEVEKSVKESAKEEQAGKHTLEGKSPTRPSGEAGEGGQPLSLRRGTPPSRKQRQD